jgi:hypothetical protein
MKNPSCKFDLKSVPEVSSVISGKLDSHEPFSLVRLGDGEGLLLSVSDQSTLADIKYLESHLGKEGVSLAGLLSIKYRLIEAIQNADIIGVRDDIVNVSFEPGSFLLPHGEFLEIFRRNFKLRKVEKSLGYHGSRRIAFLHNSLGNLNLAKDSQFCSAWFHYDYHSSGDIFRILQKQERIGLISCRLRLPRLLEDLFDISIKFQEIPDMYRDSSPDRRTPDYVEQLESVLDKQLVEFPGMLYLVGGGLYGKLYCELIRSQGGVALDLGSLFDAWLGLATRPAVFTSLFNTGPDESDVPASLLLTDENISSLLQSGLDRA